MKQSSNNKIIIYLPIMAVIVLILGMFLGKTFFSDASINRMVLAPSNDKISNVLDYIDNYYVDEIDKNALAEEVIPLVLENLDPHSSYIPAKDLTQVNESLMGGFSGIGIQFNVLKDTIVVIQTIANGPSEKLGIMAGDRIIMVDDSLVAGIGITSNDVVKKLKGERGTKVKVSIKRSGADELIDFDITRDNIPLYSVDIAYMITENTGYIKINNFSRTTSSEFIDAVNKLHDQGMENIVVDLRGNPGGYLSAAIEVSDQFLTKGKLIVYTHGRRSKREEAFSTASGVCLNDKVVILLDESSASASEILAGALQDNDRGTIMGRRSFGKGLVQTQQELSDGSALRLTISRYYTPTGRCIQKPYNNGVEEYYNDIYERKLHGEMFSQDSIEFPDSLKYTTPKGKVVYGGGGIMPDIFIPADTSGLNDYYIDVMSNGLIYKFAFDYTDQHRENLSQFTQWKDMLEHLKDNNVFDEFVAYSKENGIKTSVSKIEESKAVVSNYLYAYINRNILDNEGFYPVLHLEDKTLQSAIEELEK